MSQSVRITGIEKYFEIDAFFEHIHMQKVSRRAEKIYKMIDKAMDSIHPVALYCCSKIQVLDESRFMLEGQTFHSPEVLKATEGCRYVFPNIVSCGREIEEHCRQQDKLLEQYVTMELCNYSCELARKAIFEELKVNYGLEQIHELFPGEQQWDLQEGVQIFKIFEKEASALGLEMTERGIPVPGRTAYGLILGD